MSKRQIVILGGGFGGLYAARRLERRLDPGEAEIALVSDVNFLLYTPLLPGAAGGTLEPRHVVVSLRDELKRTEVLLGRVTGADPRAKTVSVTGADGRDRELPYDQLVVSLGSVSRTLPIPGLAEHGIGFKTIAEAIALRNRLIHALEQAEASEDPAAREALLTFGFVGAGYAGLEGIAELQDFARDIVDRYPRLGISDLRFVLIEARERVMPEITEGLARFAETQLRRRGLEIRTGTTVERIDAHSVTLAGGEVIPACTAVWTAGVKPVPVVAKLGLPLGPHGRITTDTFCRVWGYDGVWAIGDAAAVPDPARPGEPCPPTCQHALRQGRVVGDNVARVLHHEPPKEFTYKTLGVFVDMGRYKAVAETMGIRWRGFPAWWLARTYHMAMMPGIKRRLRLIADWTVGLLFGRDASELGQLGHPEPLESAEPAPGLDAGGDELVGMSGATLHDRPRP